MKKPSKISKDRKKVKKIEIRQTCRKPGKTIKNVRKSVKNRQKYRKIAKIIEKLGKNDQNIEKCKKKP